MTWHFKWKYFFKKRNYKWTVYSGQLADAGSVRRHTASQLDVLCIQRSYSAFLGCHQWLFDFPMPLLAIQPVRPFSSEPWHQQGIFLHTTALQRTGVLSSGPFWRELWRSQTSASGTNRRVAFKVTRFLPHSVSHFELQSVVAAMSSCCQLLTN